MPNKPAAPNAGIALRWIIEHHWPGVGEPDVRPKMHAGVAYLFLVRADDQYPFLSARDSFRLSVGDAVARKFPFSTRPTAAPVHRHYPGDAPGRFALRSLRSAEGNRRNHRRHSARAFAVWLGLAGRIGFHFSNGITRHAAIVQPDRRLHFHVRGGIGIGLKPSQTESTRRVGHQQYGELVCRLLLEKKNLPSLIRTSRKLVTVRAYMELAWKASVLGRLVR